MNAPASRLHRVFARIAFFECAYLLVPWQAIAYGHFDFESNQDLVIWAGAPLAWLMARALRKGEGWLAAVVLSAMWIWLVLAVVAHYDPHGMGPRNQLLLSRIFWVPLLNTTLLFVLALVAMTRRRATTAQVAAP